MNREIKFRGKRVDNNEWVYGYFMTGLNNLTYIINKRVVNETETVLDYTIVNEQSLGQFTGLQDKNGVDIYEGDVVNIDGFVGVIYFRYDRWHCKDKNNIDYDNGDYYHGDDVSWSEAEVIGNIHENPELLNND